MTEKLNPSEAQRKAMIQAAIDHSGMGSIRATEVVDAQITAADSIPEGAPVGTIARRPDGALFAARIRGSNGLLRWTVIRADWSDRGVDTADDDADSWPQIRPDEWPVSKVYSTEEAAEILGVDLTAQQEPCKSYNGPIVGYGKVVRRTRTPRVLPTLDCEEARDGTVWTDSHGVLEWHYRFRGVWERLPVYGSRTWDPLRALNHLKLHGPYTEVLGDPS